MPTKKKTDGGPAFPVVRVFNEGRECYEVFSMSLRDWFAGQALVGCLMNPETGGGLPEKIAKWTYDLADAMIAEREKES